MEDVSILDILLMMQCIVENSRKSARGGIKLLNFCSRIIDKVKHMLWVHWHSAKERNNFIYKNLPWSYSAGIHLDFGLTSKHITFEKKVKRYQYKRISFQKKQRISEVINQIDPRLQIDPPSFSALFKKFKKLKRQKKSQK